MQLRRYFLVGASIGLVLPALLIAFVLATGSPVESRVVVMAVPGFLPFGSTDPEQEMSWLFTVLAFLLNAISFGLLGLLLGFWRWRVAQPVGQTDA